MVAIVNPSGLHARPASEFVRAAKAFSSQITLAKIGDETARTFNAKSMLQLLAGGFMQGVQVELRAEGTDETEAIQSLAKLIESGFGE